jgi:hypothetical protein
MGVMRAMLVVIIAVILGYLVHDWISNDNYKEFAAVRTLFNNRHGPV